MSICFLLYNSLCVNILLYMEEIWKDIKGYEGLYQVSNLGRVRNIKHNRVKNTTIRPNGYEYVKLSKDNSTKNFTIHRLVAMTFIDNPNNLSDVNHKDEDKLNNSVTNLEWVSHQDNLNYGTRNIRAGKRNRISLKLYWKNKKGSI